MFQKPPNADALDQAIGRILKEMEGLSPDGKGYSDMVGNLVKLHTLKVAQTPKRVSNDTVATIIANILGIMLILNHERASIVTSKAVNFVTKLR